MSKKRERNQELQPSKMEKAYGGYLPSHQDQHHRMETGPDRYDDPVAHKDPALYDNHR